MAGKSTKRKDVIELDPKGWERFERAVDAAVKSGPKHRSSAPSKKPKPESKRQAR